MNDSFRHKGIRKKMVEALKEKGIKNERVLEAINTVPRHAFIDSAFEDFAYRDEAFPIGSGQTISQPFTVATQTQLLDPQKGESVLEIGTGSGYQTAILVALGAKVFTLERQNKIFHKTKKLLQNSIYNPFYMCYGDGYQGLPSFAPFDKILITAAAPSIPKNLLDQLKIGGRLLLPLGESTQIMTLVNKISENEIEKLEYGSYKFVPMLQNRADD